MKAIWNGVTIAESDDTIVVEGNHYFPPESVDERYLLDSDRRSTCPWKGLASYKTLTVDGDTNADAAWYYPAPKDAAAQIKDHIAFWHGVPIVEA
jgi:uncharacterized protein (DUF427 family)